MEEQFRAAIEKLDVETKELRDDRNVMLGRILALEAALGTAFARWGAPLAELETQVENALARVESDLRDSGVTSGSLEGLQGTGKMLRRMLARLEQEATPDPK